MFVSSSGSGMPCAVHVEPFQISETGSSPERPPTATHALALVHDTPCRLEAEEAATVWTLQSAPFQNSASGLPESPSSSAYSPTAAQAVVAAHETDQRPTRSGSAPAGIARASVVQLPAPPCSATLTVTGFAFTALTLPTDQWSAASVSLYLATFEL